MMRLRVIGTSLLAAAVGSSVLILASNSLAGGPIPGDGGHHSEVSFDVAVSSQPWDGQVAVKNSGKTAAVLDGIRLLGRTPGLRLLAAYTHRKSDPFQVLQAGRRSWPPGAATRPYRPIKGTRVAPARTLEMGTEYVQVIIRLQAPAKPSTVGYDAVIVRYHVGITKYSARFDQALTLCVRHKGESRVCDPRHQG